MGLLDNPVRTLESHLTNENPKSEDGNGLFQGWKKSERRHWINQTSVKVPSVLPIVDAQLTFVWSKQ